MSFYQSAAPKIGEKALGEGIRSTDSYLNRLNKRSSNPEIRNLGREAYPHTTI
jgi:hypothetical protein